MTIISKVTAIESNCANTKNFLASIFILKIIKIKKTIPVLFLAGVFFFTIAGCEKEEFDCGCKNPTVRTLANAKGTLHYNSERNQYIIVDQTSDNMESFHFICSTTKQLRKLARNHKNSSIKVIYSGDEKSTCIDEAPAGPTDRVNYNFKLTGIKINKE
ncbi:hypothetical protein AHMF7605_00765 [Adhaeribacter arboris]|uniref:Uncharacterized protein n=1 Tax=Adhaeribacter arboris TaxID=2072846 RepID=A0A2T2Y9G8_9BACT|nr:hypothetical protein [Adhaeribacter arboris]PSR52157.1 hypothetical protein AHMF7605_00765 [Adhaeribacter arboris]